MAIFTLNPVKRPSLSELGAPGEERDIMVELKVLADVGLVGFPSVGKSTLLSVVSKAKPEIAEYHFTTLAPNLGMVQVPDGRSFCQRSWVAPGEERSGTSVLVNAVVSSSTLWIWERMMDVIPLWTIRPSTMSFHTV